MSGYNSQAARMEISSARRVGAHLLVSGRGFAGEQFEDLVFLEPHGFASHPPPGSVGALLQPGGRRSQAMVMGASLGKHRPDLPVGCAAFYDAHGNVIRLLSDGVSMDFQDRSVTLTGGDWTVKGDVVFEGSVTVKGDLTIEGATHSVGNITSASADAEDE